MRLQIADVVSAADSSFHYACLGRCATPSGGLNSTYIALGRDGTDAAPPASQLATWSSNTIAYRCFLRWADLRRYVDRVRAVQMANMGNLVAFRRDVFALGGALRPD